MAVCATCYGRGYVWVDLLGRPVTIPPMVSLAKPCPACHGSGTESCCEGAVGGPEDVTNNPSRP
jgi:DnaJ-class molecular chaperone